MIKYSQKEFLAALLEGDRQKCSGIVSRLHRSNVSLEDVYEMVIKKALYDIGEMWEEGKISVAAEHLASAIVESVLNDLYMEIISGKRISKSAVLACVENESHQVGIRMVADIFEINGWNTFFLGANTPTTDLVKFVGEVRPDIVALSLSNFGNIRNLENVLETVGKEFPNQKIIVGGHAFLNDRQEMLIKRQKMNYLSDLYSVGIFLKTSCLLD